LPYWRLFYHVVWGTKGREPLIGDWFASALYQRVADKAVQLDAIVHAVNGTEDHIHLAASIPPAMALAEMVRQVKGSSSHFINHELDLPVPFAWQAEYGVVSIGQKQLSTVVEYIKGQKQHHTQQTTIPMLERVSSTDA